MFFWDVSGQNWFCGGFLLAHLRKNPKNGSFSAKIDLFGVKIFDFHHMNDRNLKFIVKNICVKQMICIELNFPSFLVSNFLPGSLKCPKHYNNQHIWYQNTEINRKWLLFNTFNIFISSNWIFLLVWTMHLSWIWLIYGQWCLMLISECKGKNMKFSISTKPLKNYRKLI